MFREELFRGIISYVMLPVMVLYALLPGTVYGVDFPNIRAHGAFVAIPNETAPSEKSPYPIKSDTFSIRDNPYKYSGYYCDSESGLYYCQARYYSPELMRFINRDTYDLSNRYAYCDGDPIGKTDPNGHLPVNQSSSLNMSSGKIFAMIFSFVCGAALFLLPGSQVTLGVALGIATSVLGDVGGQIIDNCYCQTRFSGWQLAYTAAFAFAAEVAGVGIGRLARFVRAKAMAKAGGPEGRFESLIFNESAPAPTSRVQPPPAASTSTSASGGGAPLAPSEPPMPVFSRSPAEIANVEDMSTLTDPELGQLHPDTIKMFSKTRLNTFKPRQIGLLRKDQIQAFIPEQIEGMSKKLKEALLGVHSFLTDVQSEAIPSELLGI